MMILCLLWFLIWIEWGVDTPALWAGDVANMWRTAGDIPDNWNAMTKTMDIVRYEFLY
jgi:alpha-galactosidase